MGRIQNSCIFTPQSIVKTSLAITLFLTKMTPASIMPLVLMNSTSTHRQFFLTNRAIKYSTFFGSVSQPVANNFAQGTPLSQLPSHIESFDRCLNLFSYTWDIALSVGFTRRNHSIKFLQTGSDKTMIAVKTSVGQSILLMAGCQHAQTQQEL